MENLSWSTVEYLHREKTADWYWMVSIVTISIALISVILNNVIFAILIIVSSFTLSLFASKKPRTVKVEMGNSEISVGHTSYPYKELDSFWVETREAVPKILLKSKKIFQPLIIIFIDEVEPEEVKKALLLHLPEEEHTEPLLEKILVYLGF